MATSYSPTYRSHQTSHLVRMKTNITNCHIYQVPFNIQKKICQKILCTIGILCGFNNIWIDLHKNQLNFFMIHYYLVFILLDTAMKTRVPSFLPVYFWLRLHFKIFIRVIHIQLTDWILSMKRRSLAQKIHLEKVSIRNKKEYPCLEGKIVWSMKLLDISHIFVTMRM